MKCKNCGKEFKQRHENHLFCSRSCSMLFRHKDPEYSENVRIKMKATKNTKENKEKYSNTRILYLAHLKKTNLTEYNKQISRLHRNFEKYKNSVDFSDIVSDRMKRYFKDPKNIEKHSKIRKEYFKDPKNVEKQRKINKEIQNRPEVREKQRSHWKSDEYAEYRLKTMYKFKDYLFPSGKIVTVQGYENKALDELLKTYSEDDIVVASDGISKYTGIIEYELNGAHVYKPDIYIKSENLIIEVKSLWTYNLHKEQVIKKQLACVQAGFNFLLMIF